MVVAKGDVTTEGVKNNLLLATDNIGNYLLVLGSKVEHTKNITENIWGYWRPSNNKGIN